MRVLAVIPARGGSKRFPRKNVAPFLGRPILAYTVEAARASGCFERVILSTDDQDIAAAGREAGAMIHDRPAELATDTARAADVCAHLLKEEERLGRDFDVVCCLFPTAPLRGAGDIRAVVNLVVPGVHDYAMAVTGFHYPAWQALKPGEDGALHPMFPEIIDKSSQAVGPLYVDNGSTYAVTARVMRRDKTFNGPAIRGHVMPRERSVDIDLPEDLELAEFYAAKTGIAAQDE
ncbi:cytidylyltransferase domain-containing protein [Desulfohalovibrio reitneri]|uniref:acylneuraminate cytidylyltransferase family protein n=1 Tax=Desulfohalovibrio reitneri TaxID=1307759 RepID=UPI0004A75936|nr:acylneuraminate cytidylyltransferase family protein [Desulfohalovibrio reitneri]